MTEWHADNGECNAPVCEPHLHEVKSEPAGPVPLVEGTFAVYKGPKGEVVLVTNIEGRGVEKKVFPRALIRLAQAGPLGAMLRRANGD